MKSTLRSCIVCLAFIFTLVGCSGSNTMAPVSELKWHPYFKYQKRHIVRRGETLYAISFRYDTDYRQLAQLNHLKPPYSLRVGQVLNVQVGRKTPGRQARRPAPVRAASKPKYQTQSRLRSFFTPSFSVRSSSGWSWPAKGRIVASFVPTQGKKGIDIASNKGEKVHAASQGVVAYAGSGLSGYGNLIIIKHNNQFLTAYGNNSRNLVREGQVVKSGQVIAEVGVVDHRYYGVHFEIRKAGVPVNPLNYLQKG